MEELSGARSARAAPLSSGVVKMFSMDAEYVKVAGGKKALPSQKTIPAAMQTLA